MVENLSETLLRQLLTVWIDFSARLDSTPLFARLLAGTFRLEDYKMLLLNHRQQVIEGGRWIARAASNIDQDYAELRSKFIRHCVTEHQDYKMLEKDYVSIGGDISEIQQARKNIGTEALNAYMFFRASQPNPFGLLGSMFIIEGLGKNKAGEWGTLIRDQLNLTNDQVRFFLYHGQHDEDHTKELEDILTSDLIQQPELCQDIVRTAEVTARLYLLQIEEMEKYEDRHQRAA